MSAQLVLNSNDVVNPRLVVPVNFRMLPENITNISELPESSNFISQIFPVPANNYLMLRLHEIEEDGLLLLYNAQGMLTMMQTLPADTRNIRLDVSRLASGSYHLVVKTNSGVDSRKSW